MRKRNKSMKFKKKLLLSLKGHLFSGTALLLLIFILSLAVFFGGYLYQVYQSFYDHVICADGFSMGIESENGISDVVLESILSMDEAVGYNNAVMQTFRCIPVDFVNTAYESDREGDDDAHQSEKNQVISSLPVTEEVVLCGNFDTKWNQLFVNGSLELIKGNWPESGTSQVILDEYLCQKNGLQIGDSITVLGEDQKTKYQFIVTGIYSAVSVPCETVYVNGEACELETGSSYIFCDADIWEQISGTPVSDQLIDVYADSKKNLDLLMEKADSTLESDYTVYNNVADRIQDHYTMLYTLKLFSTGSFILIAALSIVILGLQLLYWMQGQYLDAGIYLALGMKERAVKCLLLAKTMVISTIALTLSTLVSLVLGYYKGDAINKVIFSLPMMPDWKRYSADLFRIENNLWIVKNNLFYMMFFAVLVSVVLHFLFKNSVKKLLK